MKRKKSSPNAKKEKAVFTVENKIRLGEWQES